MHTLEQICTKIKSVTDTILQYRKGRDQIDDHEWDRMVADCQYLDREIQNQLGCDKLDKSLENIKKNLDTITGVTHW
jgi:hypothetical protein